MFYDVSKPYRDKVAVFNATSFYGSEQARIQQDVQNRTETRSQGGLNETAHEPSYWEKENPHRSVMGDQSYLNNYGLWNTKYKQTDVNKLQYIQAPQLGYVKNKWVEHLEEIERNRVSNIKPSFNGNGEMTLEIDNNT
jgi:hypothetical protein